MESNSERVKELQNKKICRFCLSQQMDKLSIIYIKNAKLKSTASLAVQIQATVNIEVSPNDGMPTWICIDCRLLFEYSYRFRDMCRRAEMLLRQYPLTSQWPEPLVKPSFPKQIKDSTLSEPVEVKLSKLTQNSPNDTSLQSKSKLELSTKLQKQQPQESQQKPTEQLQLKQEEQNVVVIQKRKLLNSNPVESPEPPVPIRIRKEKFNDVLEKVDNNEELSMDDVQRLLETVSKDEEFIAPAKPKLLNKSSIRILNKDAEIVVEPRLSEPQLKRDNEGNVEIVTEIIDSNEQYETEPDRIKNAAPIETNVYPCPHCERSFPLLQLRDIHMVNHNRERSFQCSSCEKSFFSKYDLQKHSVTHTGDRPFKCTICVKSFTRATLLHRHERSHTDIPKYICVYCEKPFISREEMEKHTERHRKVRPYECKICDKAFAFKQGLERHEVVHSREQPYPCQYCDLSFSTPSKLARHLTVHAGVRPYPCKFCSKSFLLSHHLTRHMRSHKQAESFAAYKCSDCNKVYKTREEHIYHSAVHATKTLACLLCRETFLDASTITSHIKDHAEGETYACAFCDLIFLTSTRLQQHADDDHTEETAAYLKNEKIQEVSIEDFVIDELPEESMQLLQNDKLFDATMEGKIIKLKPKQAAEVCLELGEINSVNNKLKEEIKQEKYSEVPQSNSPKFRKVVLKNSTSMVKVVGEVMPSTSLLRRKAPVAAQKKEPIKKIKVEERISESSHPKTIVAAVANVKENAINSVLKALPKSVSVRRNAAASVPAVQIVNKSTDVETQPKQRLLRFTHVNEKESFTTKTTARSNTSNKTIKQKSTADAVDHKDNLKKIKSLMEQQTKLKLDDGILTLTKSKSK